MRKLVLSVALALVPITASAAVIVDTGVPSGSAGYNIFDEGPSSYQAEAARFTFTAATQITSIQGWFGSSSFGQDKVRISIYDDPSGVGTLLTSELATVPDYRVSGDSWVGAFTNGATVLAAGNYWVSFSADRGAPDRCNCWMPANNTVTIPQGAYNNSFTGGNWAQRELYFGLRITGEMANAVPEPQSWALMLTGFGLAGFGLRRRNVLSPATAR